MGKSLMKITSTIWFPKYRKSAPASPLYQKITDIYATAVDYSVDSKTTKDFFATVQNKMHYAVHGSTAAEVIVQRADHTKDHMGLTSWKNAPNGKIVKADVSVAKNYLQQR